MLVIKRDKESGTQKLVESLDKLIPLLKNQNENDACDDLEDAKKTLAKEKPGSIEHKKAIDLILAAFEDEHELMAYTYQRPDAIEWTEREELALASSRVLSLAKSFKT